MTQLPSQSQPPPRQRIRQLIPLLRLGQWPTGDCYNFSSFAGICIFNGCGEMTSSHWINETGLLHSPIVLTATTAVSDAFRGIWEYAAKYHTGEDKAFNIFPMSTIAILLTAISITRADSTSLRSTLSTAFEMRLQIPCKKGMREAEQA